MIIPDSSKRTQRYFEIARRAAHSSTYGNIKHGAVLIKSGRILNISFNKENFCSFGARFRKRTCGPATVHAEIGAILGMAKKLTEGADIYVVRVGKNDNFQMSKPCDMCQEVMKFVGIRRVFYTSQSGGFEMLKLKREEPL